jgi:hypothetical protein
VVHESVALLMEVGKSSDKLSLGERLIWIEKGADLSGGDAVETRMRRRAGSKSLVRVGVEHHDESI